MKRFKDRTEMIRFMPLHSVGVEIGVFQGDFSAQILTTGVGTLHLVDPWKQYPEYASDSRNEPTSVQDNYHRQVCGRFSGEISTGRVIVHRLTSIEAANLFMPESLDWVFIDGNHQYEFVLEDLMSWAPKVRYGGCIMGHDYDGLPQAKEIKCGVKEAVQRFCDISQWKMTAMTEEPVKSFALCI